MSIQEYIQFFNEQLQQTTRKSHKRALSKFITILTDLERRELGIEKNEAIIAELDRLELTSKPPKRKKSYARSMSTFTNFLNKHYSLVVEGHYTTLGMVLGMTFGIGIGTALGTAIDPASGTAIGISMGIGIGMAIGIAIGAAKDKEALAAGRVIKLK